MYLFFEMSVMFIFSLIFSVCLLIISIPILRYIDRVLFDRQVGSPILTISHVLYML